VIPPLEMINNGVFENGYLFVLKSDMGVVIDAQGDEIMMINPFGIESYYYADVVMGRGAMKWFFQSFWTRKDL
jgi:hypothetical protein